MNNISQNFVCNFNFCQIQPKEDAKNYGINDCYTPDNTKKKLSKTSLFINKIALKEFKKWKGNKNYIKQNFLYKIWCFCQI